MPSASCTVAASRSPTKKSFHPYTSCFMMLVRLTTSVAGSGGTVHTGGDQLLATLRRDSRLSAGEVVLTYFHVDVDLRVPLLNSDDVLGGRISALWLTGGGGVWPIHSTRSAVPLDRG